MPVDFVRHLRLVGPLGEELLYHDEGFGDGHGGVGEVVCAVCVETGFHLLGLGVAVVLDVSVF